MKILFLHGWNSVPGGKKPSYLVQHGHTVINPRLPDDDFDDSVRIAQAEFDMHQPPVVVGSSRGGAVAMNINSGKARLILLCPAWKKYGSATTVKADTVILHSRADDIVPFADSDELVKNSGLPAYTLIEVGTDHRLADTLSKRNIFNDLDWGILKIDLAQVSAGFRIHQDLHSKSGLVIDKITQISGRIITAVLPRTESSA